jgi:hypothetical protein
MAVALLVSGCCTPDLDVDPHLILGTGEVEFEPLRDGTQEVGLINGIQGGVHVWASVRATGLDWRDLRLDFTLLDPDGDPVSEPSRTLADLACCDATDCEGFGEIVGFPVLVDSPAMVAGRILTLRVDATDPDGLTASAERLVIPER